MKPTDVLKQEHRIIEQVLNCLEAMSSIAVRDGQLDKESAEQAIDFFRNFADKCHHGKEETHLFTMMEAKGYPRHGGPTGVMLHEHEQGRAFIKAMDGAIDAASQGEAQAIKTFTQNAQNYIAMLREHINKEDHCLFSMADSAFSEEDQKSLQAEFEHVEHEEMGEGTHETYLNIANQLADKYGVPKANIPHEALKCCGH